MSKKFGDQDWFPETRGLRYFVCVAEEKNMTRAAARLRIAQPALSRQVTRLEQELGTPLFMRLPRGVELTDAGEILLEHCYTTFKQFSQTFRAVTTHSSRPEGVVVVGMPPTPGEFIVPPLLARIRDEYPNVELRFVEGFSRELEKALISGDIAIAVMHDPPERSDIQRRVLLTESLNIVGSPGSLVQNSYRLSEVARFPLIMPPRPNYLRIIFDRAANESGLSTNVVQRVDGVWHLKALVRAGHGFTVLTQGGVLTESRSGTLAARPITDPEITWDLCTAMRLDQARKAAVAVVEKTINDVTADLVERRVWA